MNTQDKYDSYLRAKERVKAIKDFYGSLLAYCIVIPFLFWINWTTIGFSIPWAFFPAIGWGFGLLMQGMEAYGYNPFLGKHWEARKIEELMDAEQKGSTFK
ncbi:2TM domain-containing protein [Robiginitalea aurantiaca]|uniref:2TM domain-containing protein n=1 Tax=Robiginitalea aurantiaca TaxID=3056915 RepID=A0ABT7WCJ9_9FLAO|nr:2TM domain-containing protein [Robiginitalea aurantiaca]MDM9630628.1 2TM domain-containing protein [Robiginitalea aurantiaca]